MVDAYVASARAPVIPMSAPCLGGPYRTSTRAVGQVAGNGYATQVVTTTTHPTAMSSPSGTAGRRHVAVTLSGTLPEERLSMTAAVSSTAAAASSAASPRALEHSRAELQRAEAREAKLRDELAAERATVQELQDAVDSLRLAQFSALRGSVDAGDGVVPIQQVEAARAQGEDALAYAYNQVQVAEMRATGLSRELEAARATAEAAASGLAAKEAEVARLNAQVQAVQSAAKQAQEALQQQSTAMAKEQSARRAEGEVAARRAEAAEQRANRWAARVDELVSEAKEAQCRAMANSDAAAKADAAQAEHAAAAQRIADLESRCFERDMQLGEVEARVAESEATVVRVKAEAESHKRALLERAARAETELAKLKDERAQLQSQITESDRARNQANAEIVATTGRLADAERVIALLQEQKRSSAQEVADRDASVVERLRHAEARAAKAEDEVRALRRHAATGPGPPAAAQATAADIAGISAECEDAAETGVVTTEGERRDAVSSTDRSGSGVCPMGTPSQAAPPRPRPSGGTPAAGNVEDGSDPTPRSRLALKESNLWRKFDAESSRSFKGRSKGMSSKELQILQHRLQASALRSKAAVSSTNADVSPASLGDTSRMQSMASTNAFGSSTPAGHANHGHEFAPHSQDSSRRTIGFGSRSSLQVTPQAPSREVQAPSQAMQFATTGSYTVCTTPGMPVLPFAVSGGSAGLAPPSGSSRTSGASPPRQLAGRAVVVCAL
mmetsp:Transcript_77300/g.224254  ORF Transcript_77300/g.224254 Transcript_77300/m.224254 type:complete len:734 (+) Transcript_77300:72-2273(+)